MASAGRGGLAETGDRAHRALRGPNPQKAENLRTGRLLAVADPSIVEAGREVAAIGKLYPQKCRVISNALVKESDLKTMLGAYDLVHLSVHGKFTAQEPLLSHLKLEPGDADDGQLTAAEMFGLPLQNTRLVVLLAIGVKAYQNKDLSLSFADQDALKMAAMFKAQEGVLFNRVHAEILTNEQVTREEVIDKLDWMNRQSSQGDVVVLFLSGHGSLSKGNYYFWTHKHDPQVNPERYDVKWSTLIDGLTAVPGTKPILFVDSCRAAAATGARRKGDEGLTEALKDLKQNYQGVFFFAASKDNEDSIEMDSLGHGAFTYSLLDGLKGNADVPPKDQIVYINELGNWVRAQVRKLTGEKQHAVYEEPPEKSGFQPFPIFVLPKR